MKFDPSLPDDSVNVSRSHPLREALVLVVGVAAVATGVFFAGAFALDALVKWIPPELEARLFADALPGSIAGTSATTGEDPREAAVAELLGRMSAHWAENPYELRVAVLAASAPNAFAFPGGYVVVTTGLLDSVESENELAFVLAHEVGHFRNRDHLAGVGRGVALGLVVATFGLGGSGAAARIAGVAGGIAATSFSRDQERDADEFALGLVQTEYGHVAGATAFFDALPEADVAAPDGIAHYLSTHPQNADRSEVLQRLATAKGWLQVGPLVSFAAGREAAPTPPR